MILIKPPSMQVEMINIGAYGVVPGRQKISNFYVCGSAGLPMGTKFSLSIGFPFLDHDTNYEMKGAMILGSNESSDVTIYEMSCDYFVPPVKHHEHDPIPLDT